MYVNAETSMPKISFQDVGLPFTKLDAAIAYCAAVAFVVVEVERTPRDAALTFDVVFSIVHETHTTLLTVYIAKLFN